MTTAADLLAHFRYEYLASVAAFEKAEDTFAAITAGWLAHEAEQVIAETKAASDPARRTAQADAAYYRDRALMYAAGVQVLYAPLLAYLRRLPADTTPADSDLREAHPVVTRAAAGYRVGTRWTP